MVVVSAVKDASSSDGAAVPSNCQISVHLPRRIVIDVLFAALKQFPIRKQIEVAEGHQFFLYEAGDPKS